MATPVPPRRAFLRNGVLALAGLGMRSAPSADAETEAAPILSAGLLTDLHYADKETAGRRHYRDTLRKLEEAVARFNRSEPGFVVELGDFIDRAESVDQELAWLETVEAHYGKLRAPRHYVLGNHCVDTLTKAEFAEHVGATPPPHYAFEEKGFRFVVLDACYKEDGTPYQRRNFHWQDSNIPRAELRWLEDELASSSSPVVVFAHQRLDLEKNHAVRNAAEVRGVLERSGRVVAVFQGHSHKNDYQQIAGIHYTTLAAMVEGAAPEHNAYAELDFLPDGSLRLRGFHVQDSRGLAA